MRTIDERELRTNTTAVLDAVVRGETLRIARHGFEVAELRGLTTTAFVASEEIVRRLGRFPAGDLEKLRREADELLRP